MDGGKRVKDHQALAKLEKKIGQMKIYLLHRGIIFYLSSKENLIT